MPRRSRNRPGSANCWTRRRPTAERFGSCGDSGGVISTKRRSYRRSRTLWEGRFKSCLVQNERYHLECYRYSELNPVRAGMVDDSADFFIRKAPDFLKTVGQEPELLATDQRGLNTDFPHF